MYHRCRRRHVGHTRTCNPLVERRPPFPRPGDFTDRLAGRVTSCDPGMRRPTMGRHRAVHDSTVRCLCRLPTVGTSYLCSGRRWWHLRRQWTSTSADTSNGCGLPLYGVHAGQGRSLSCFRRHCAQKCRSAACQFCWWQEILRSSAQCLHRTCEQINGKIT